MLSSENTGSSGDETEACRPSFQSPLQLKATSTGFLGKPKHPGNASKDRDVDLVLPTLVLRREPNKVGEQQADRTLADGKSVSALPSHANVTITEDSNPLRTTESTVIGPVEETATERKQVESAELEYVADDDNDSDWSDETETESDSISQDRKSSITAGRCWKDAQCHPECYPAWMREAESDNENEDDESESHVQDRSNDVINNGCGDFRQRSQDSLCPETEDSVVPDLTPINPDLEVPVDPETDDSDNHGPTGADARLDSAVDSWIEEARVEAAILIASNKNIFSSSQEDSQVPHDITEFSEVSDLDATYRLVRQYERTIVAEIASDATKLAEMHAVEINSAEMNLREIDYAEEYHVAVGLENVNSKEEKSNNNNLSKMINSDETNSLEIDFKETDLAEVHCSELQPAELSPSDANSVDNFFAEGNVDEIISVETSSVNPDAGEMQTVADLYNPHAADLFFSNSHTESSNADACVFNLTLPGTQTVEAQNASTESTDANAADAKSTDSNHSDTDRSDTESSVSRHADRKPGLWNFDDSESSDLCVVDMDLADLSADSDAELEFVCTHFVSTNQSETQNTDSTDLPRVEEDQRSRDSPSTSIFRNLLLTFMRNTLGAWMRCWGPDCCY